MIFGRLICVFGGLVPVSTRLHASVEDITSLQSVKKILLQLYGIPKSTLTVFSTSSLFLVTVTGRAAAPRKPAPPYDYSCDRIRNANV